MMTKDPRHPMPSTLYHYSQHDQLSALCNSLYHDHLFSLSDAVDVASVFQPTGSDFEYSQKENVVGHFLVEYILKIH